MMKLSGALLLVLGCAGFGWCTCRLKEIRSSSNNHKSHGSHACRCFKAYHLEMFPKALFLPVGLFPLHYKHSRQKKQKKRRNQENAVFSCFQAGAYAALSEK